MLRWGLFVAYVGLVYAGVLDVSTRALLISASLHGAYNVYHTWLEFWGDPSSPLLFTIHRHIDPVIATITLIALHDVRSPVWAAYFLGIMSLAHMLTRNQMIEQVGWVTLNYIAFAVVTAALGTNVSWSYVTVVATLISFTAFSASLLAGGEQRLRDVIAVAAATDSLTGLANRRHFQERYFNNLAEAVARRVPLALMLLDVDHFKLINDRDGHPAGDEKLRDIARALESAVRREDLVARYGGDEFVVVAPNTSRVDALHLAERIRTAAIETGASVSVGVALYPDDATEHDSLVAAADAALYRAKQAGRNCVRVTQAA